MIVPLFTETGIMPLAVCRFILVLSNMRYLLSLDHGHFARAAMFNSIDLFLQSKSSWFGVATCHLCCHMNYTQETYHLIILISTWTWCERTQISGYRMKSTALISSTCFMDAKNRRKISLPLKSSCVCATILMYLYWNIEWPSPDSCCPIIFSHWKG